MNSIEELFSRLNPEGKAATVFFLNEFTKAPGITRGKEKRCVKYIREQFGYTLAANNAVDIIHGYFRELRER